MTRSSHPLPMVARLGLIGFAVGAVAFVVAPGIGGYRLEPRSVSLVVMEPTVKAEHVVALRVGLVPVTGREFSHVGGFAAAIDEAIDRVNLGLPDSGKIWDYDRGQYTLALARAASRGPVANNPTPYFWLSLGLMTLGGLLFAIGRIRGEPAGIKNHGVFHRGLSARGAAGIALGVILIGAYILLYFYPVYIVRWIALADPVSHWMRDRPADRWFFYGLLYTLVVIVMGLRMAVNYRHSRYHLIRTGSVVFFQLGFAFVLPAVLEFQNLPAQDLKLAWPLDYTLFYGYRLDGFFSGGPGGWAVFLWSLALAFVAIPALAAFFGKRWYCSWVCGCGGLAETLGDPFRQLSDKSLVAWKLERWMVHGVLVAAVLMTGVVLADRATGGGLGSWSWRVQSWYGFAIGSVFAGVVGTGFYPLMGSRVWCRFGCPLAAILGIVQRFGSRFRITTNGGQCISCGNCSTYCEMGIDVRWYAQRGEPVVRAACVGCGVCSAVCPRGVLRLENGPISGRFEGSELIQLGGGANGR